MQNAPFGTFYNTFDLHSAIIGLDIQVFVLATNNFANRETSSILLTIVLGLFQKKIPGGGRRQTIYFSMGGWCIFFHWCLKKFDYMGGGVLSENWLLMFDRYIKSNVPVSIKILKPNLPVFLLCEILQSMHKLIYFVWKQNKVVFRVYKAVTACQTQLQYAIGKQHNNLRKFPNAGASITRGVGLGKHWLFQLSPLYYQLSGTNEGDVRQKNTN